MTKDKNKPSQEMIDRSTAALIVSTRRVGRKLNLLEIAEHISVARSGLGSLKAVSEKIGLSTEMLRQFASVEKLSPKVKQLIADRRIDSVDVARNLCKLSVSDQNAVASKVVAGQLTSDDVRAVLSLRKEAPSLRINEVIRKVKQSRNIKEYVAEFIIPSKTSSIGSLRSRFAKVVGGKNIRSLRATGRVATLALNSEGKKRFQNEAKLKGLTKRSLIEEIIKGRE